MKHMHHDGTCAVHIDTRTWATTPLWDQEALLKGLKERPLKGPLGLYRGFMTLYKRYIRVI